MRTSTRAATAALSCGMVVLRSPVDRNDAESAITIAWQSSQTPIATVKCLTCITGKLDRQRKVPVLGWPLPSKSISLLACCYCIRLSEIVHRRGIYARIHSAQGPILSTELGGKQVFQ